MSSNDLVLVTGGSGFLGAHVVLALINKGYRVRTTVRSLKRKDEVKQMLRIGGATEEQAEAVEFFAADLTSDDGWQEACKGCKYVHHVASPFPASVPKNEDDLVVPARDGTLRALRAAKAAGTVKRVVLTSSTAAVVGGHDVRKEPFTEEDWTRLDNPTVPTPPYPKSKTVAEQAAWDYIEKEGGDMELAVVNPGGIYGPVLNTTLSTSLELVVRLMKGALPACPQISFASVDVRDVADLHIRAMVDPKAKGERFIAVSGESKSIQDIAFMLKKTMGDKANKVPTRQLPNLALKVVAWFDPTVAMIVPELGKVKEISSEKAQSVLGWQPRSVEEAVTSSAESCEKLGLFK